MAVLDIVKYPAPALRVKTERVSATDPSTQQLVDDMLDTLYSTLAGVGLAAPQVGSNKRVIVIATNRKEHAGTPLILINPTILQREGRTISERENCLSLPGLYVDVERSVTVQVDADDRMGNRLHLSESHFASFVLQHEIDHLHGVLVVDYLTEYKKGEYWKTLIGRNSQCLCGSGKKFKKCHGSLTSEEEALHGRAP